MESDYNYWWWNTTKPIKYQLDYKKSLFVRRAIDGLLKCVKN